MASTVETIDPKRTQCRRTIARYSRGPPVSAWTSGYPSNIGGCDGAPIGPPSSTRRGSKGTSSAIVLLPAVVVRADDDADDRSDRCDGACNRSQVFEGASASAPDENLIT